MKIEVWSDVVCPWCYIGKRRLERAVVQFDEPVEVEWRSFELDPNAKASPDAPLVELLARKYRVSVDQAHAMMERVVSAGQQEGIEFDVAAAQTGNTFEAHQLIHLAKTAGLAPALKERLLQAYFCAGKAIADRETLVALAAEVGLDADDARDALESQRFADAVRGDEAEARAIGAHGVPFFLIDGKYAVSGAQESETMLAVFRQVQALNAVQVDAGEGCGETCDGPPVT